MSSDNQDPLLSENWSERDAERDDEALAWHVWARQLARREKAMANPVKTFETQDDNAAGRDRPTGANDPKPA